MVIKRTFMLVILLSILLILTGCLYPDHDRARQIPHEDQIAAVQDAVLEYREDNDGILPLKNKEAETDLYIKYLIDFNRLVPKYLPDIPSNSFERGGTYQYVIIDPEDNPTVKIFDLTIAEQIRDIKLRLSTREFPPFDKQIDKGVFSLNFEKLGYKEIPTVLSPFTGNNLSFIISGEGQIFVDYSSDLYLSLQELIDVEVKPGDDIRLLLTENSYFVPAYSLPYTVDGKGDVIFLEEN